MKVLVAVKYVVDSDIDVCIKPDNTGVDIENIKKLINPFDEVAVEESVCLKENGFVNEVVVVSIGSIECKSVLKTALEMGADRGILIEHDYELNPLYVSKLLRKIYEIEKPRLFLLGKQETDNDYNQTGQMLASLLNLSQGTFVSKLSIIDKDYINVVREIDGGTELLKLKLPSIVTVDLKLNEPRYITFSNILKAKNKKINIIKSFDLGIDISNNYKIFKFIKPEIKTSCIMMSNAKELLCELKSKKIL